MLHYTRMESLSRNKHSSLLVAFVSCKENEVLSKLGNCDFDFFNFCHCQVWNFEILNQSKRNQNFAINFWKYQKQKRKSTKYLASTKQSIIPINFCAILLVSWNFVNFVKSCKFCKSLKDLRLILLKWLGKTVKYWLNFINFFHGMKNGLKVCKPRPKL